MGKLNAVLLIFTGGTISMAEDPATGALRPIDFQRLQEYMPEIRSTGVRVDCYPFDPFIDSSDVHPPFWCKLAQTIYDNYDNYDGFVVLHGTDTMSFSASALSFMLDRTTKKNTEHFSAFASYNYPPLAKAGVHIKFFPSSIHYPEGDKPLRLHTMVDQNVAILKLFPGITEHTVNSILNIPNLRAVVLETFGSGNAPRRIWFYKALKSATERGIIIVNKTQCSSGAVEMGRYETSLNLLNAGVISGYDITTEAIVTKLMYLLGEYGDNVDKVKELLNTNICGEMTIE